MSAIAKTNKIYFFLFAFSLIALGLCGFAIAHAASSSPANSNPGSTLSQRVAQRKIEQNIRLSKPDMARLQSQCTGVQSVIRTLTDSYTTSSNNRDKIYRGIDAKLWIIIGSLKLDGKDTFKLEQQRDGYIKRVQAFENESNQFQQAISDLAAINCQADPAGFQALIQTARAYNAQIRSSFINIKSYLIDQIQPIITQQADALKLNT